MVTTALFAAALWVLGISAHETVRESVTLSRVSSAAAGDGVLVTVAVASSRVEAQGSATPFVAAGTAPFSILDAADGAVTEYGWRSCTGSWRWEEPGPCTHPGFEFDSVAMTPDPQHALRSIAESASVDASLSALEALRFLWPGGSHAAAAFSFGGPPLYRRLQTVHGSRAGSTLVASDAAVGGDFCSDTAARVLALPFRDAGPDDGLARGASVHRALGFRRLHDLATAAVQAEHGSLQLRLHAARLPGGIWQRNATSTLTMVLPVDRAARLVSVARARRVSNVEVAAPDGWAALQGKAPRVHEANQVVSPINISATVETAGTERGRLRITIDVGATDARHSVDLLVRWPALLGTLWTHSARIVGADTRPVLVAAVRYGSGVAGYHLRLPWSPGRQVLLLDTSMAGHHSDEYPPDMNRWYTVPPPVARLTLCGGLGRANLGGLHPDRVASLQAILGAAVCSGEEGWAVAGPSGLVMALPIPDRSMLFTAMAFSSVLIAAVVSVLIRATLRDSLRRPAL